MSLATRCTACGTVFRVVQDQLKVSEGWVRCGRCGEVFNAIEGLFDLEGTSGPIPLARDLPPADPPVQPPAPAAPAEEAALPASLPPLPEDEPEAVATQADSRLDTEVDPRGESGFGRSRPVSRFDDIDLIDSVVPEDAVSAPHAGDEPPGFLRDADAAAQWHRPRVRRSLWLLCGLMALVLATQVAVRQRAELAARWPGSVPLLSTLCETLGCSLEAPRRLDALAVDSSGLTRVEGSPMYRLQIALRNRTDVPSLMPAFDLTLTNLRGEVIARRVLRAADFGTRLPDRIAPGAELPIDAMIDVGENRIAGYTIELFYPEPESAPTMPALICGSLAFDTITNFPGRFAQQILPEQVHILNVSFVVPTLRREWGGCAGNIAYTLKLLGGEPVILAALGSDGDEYLARLKALGMDTSSVLVAQDQHTAQCMIITDQGNNQITAFHPGAMSVAHRARVPTRGERADLAIGIIAPDGREAMAAHAEQLHEAGIPFIFDPGQQLPQFDGAEHRDILGKARWVALNDYEGHMLCDRVGESLEAISRRDNIEGIVVTLAEQGCDVWQRGRVTRVPGVRAQAVVDPTGCGDAVRAGLLYGLERGWALERAAQLGMRLGAVKIAERGGQNHRFDAAAMLG